MWSLGITLYVLMARKEPYLQMSFVKRMQAMNSNQREKLPGIYSQQIRDLVDNLLTVD
jgi:hypothetical protein